jgi:hypothetical protein
MNAAELSELRDWVAQHELTPTGKPCACEKCRQSVAAQKEKQTAPQDTKIGGAK